MYDSDYDPDWRGPHQPDSEYYDESIHLDQDLWSAGSWLCDACGIVWSGDSTFCTSCGGLPPNSGQRYITYPPRRPCHATEPIIGLARQIVASACAARSLASILPPVEPKIPPVILDAADDLLHQCPRCLALMLPGQKYCHGCRHSID